MKLAETNKQAKTKIDIFKNILLDFIDRDNDSNLAPAIKKLELATSLYKNN